MLTFAKRNIKEIVKDPITLVFGLGFPVVLILLLSAIQANIPEEIFKISSLAPGMTVFGLSFMTLFSATLISKDRESAFLQRLFASPLKAFDFILGYAIPILPIALLQSVVCFAVGIPLGLDVSVNMIYSVLFTIPTAIVFIGFGLLFGSLLTQKQVGGICGALLTNLTAWFSGIWFDLELVGGVFKKIAQCLPFYHAVEMQKAVFQGNFSDIFPHIFIVLAYGILVFALAIFFFLKQMKK